jgi:tRNA U34 5-carboxymethylaminomethyl modifying GTPase MnmE/TrmE
VEFGEVSDRPATTRHVEGAALLVNGAPLVELSDTPGLEDSIGLLEHLDQLRRDRQPDWLKLIRGFLASPAAQGEFEQEAKALRQVLASDVSLYVIDARDRVLGKHRDELEILGRCARPVVPVLNFVASPEARTAEWREHLARVNMHAVAEFDTVVLNEYAEQRLFEKMETLLDPFRPTLEALIADRQRLRTGLVRTSADLLADLLIDVAAGTIIVAVDADKTAVMESLRQMVRRREQRCVDALLELFQFQPDAYEAEELPIEDGEWGLRSYADSSDSDMWGGQDVYDVYTTSEEQALDETYYRDW